VLEEGGRIDFVTTGVEEPSFPPTKDPGGTVHRSMRSWVVSSGRLCNISLPYRARLLSALPRRDGHQHMQKQMIEKDLLTTSAPNLFK